MNLSPWDYYLPRNATQVCTRPAYDAAPAFCAVQATLIGRSAGCRQCIQPSSSIASLRSKIVPFEECSSPIPLMTRSMSRGQMRWRRGA